jgi:RNA recognition motif-containing protein
MKLLVRNLARTTTEDELLELFGRYGSVQSQVNQRVLAS